MIWRLLKGAIPFGTAGLMAEGAFELRPVRHFFMHPPSVPGKSKIIEYFGVQHLLLPTISVMVVFWPPLLKRLFALSIWRIYLGALMILVSFPELLVSFQSDLFRLYPFDLQVSFMAALQSLILGDVPLNLIQAQHLIFAHLALIGSLVCLCVYPTTLRCFAGPHTGEERFVPKQ